MTTLPVEGRVFSRMMRFASLPQDLQQDTKAVQALLVQHKDNVFGTHHTMLVQSVYSVKGKALIESIVKWLEDRHTEAQVAQSSQTPSATATTPATSTGPQATTQYGLEATDRHHAPFGVQDTMPPGGLSRGVLGSYQANFLARARQIADALVLSGFLTPHDDDIKHMNAPPPDHYVDDSDLLVPVAKEITRLRTTSVWSVLDGTIYAKFLKRKAGLLGPISSGKGVYVVLNEKTQCAYLFESDLARESIAEFDAKSVSVEFDDSSFEFGVRAASTSGDDVHLKPEEFNCGTKHLQEEFINAWLNIGALYREVYHGEMEHAHSIYQFMDLDIHGNPVSFDKYRGKVLLLVNVASGCKMAFHNFPALTVLHEKYRDRGFEVLAFPCNQFGSEEPRNHEEIVQYVSQFNANYQLFEKADVNGSHARPVFTFLKAKLPGTFGSFVKWNFTKFLVDRNGVPYKRYSPKDSPLDLERDIQELLNTRGNSQAQQQGFAQVDQAGARAQANLNRGEGQQGYTQQSGFDKSQHAGTHAPVYSSQFEGQQGMPQQADYGMGQQAGYANQTGGQQGLNRQSDYAGAQEQPQLNQLKREQDALQPDIRAPYDNQFGGQQGMPQQTGFSKEGHSGTHAPHQAYADEPHAP
ncbi:Phospholipid hydroperoxide glutathione, partial [Globisporangium splendens]